MVELPSGGRKRVFDRNLNIFVSAVVRRRVIDYDIFVRRDRKQNMDLKSAAVTVFVARCDYSYVKSNDVAIVLFQPLHFAFDRSAYRRRRIASFKIQLQWNLHDDLSVFASASSATEPPFDFGERASTRANQWRPGAI
jgi:hypothetical protein